MAGKHDPMRNIDVRETDDGLVYRIRVTYKGKKYSATRDTPEDALTWKKDTLARLKSGKPLQGDIADGDMKFSDASGKLISSRGDRSKSTIEGYQWAELSILKYFGNNVLLSEVTPVRVYEFVDYRRNTDHVGASKIGQELSFIRQVYQNARGLGSTLQSPELDIKRPKKLERSREDQLARVIKKEELTCFLETVRQRKQELYLFLIFLLYTGMRPTEAASLRWKALDGRDDANARLAKEHRGFVDFTRGGFSKVGTKTNPRFVPGHPVAMKIIKTLQKKQKNQKKEDLKRKFVFILDEHGQKDRPYLFFRTVFRNAKRDSRKDDGTKLRSDIDFYSFRHTARSRMGVCGVQDSAAETIIGHEGNKMQAVYTHYEDDDLINEIKKLDYPWLEI